MSSILQSLGYKITTAGVYPVTFAGASYNPESVNLAGKVSKPRLSLLFKSTINGNTIEQSFWFNSQKSVKLNLQSLLRTLSVVFSPTNENNLTTPQESAQIEATLEKAVSLVNCLESYPEDDAQTAECFNDTTLTNLAIFINQNARKQPFYILVVEQQTTPNGPYYAKLDTLSSEQRISVRRNDLTFDVSKHKISAKSALPNMNIAASGYTNYNNAQPFVIQGEAASQEDGVTSFEGQSSSETTF